MTTKYPPELVKSDPSNPDTVFAYDASGDFELVLKSSLAGVLDIDSLPLVTTADGADKLAISDNGTESSITLTNLANALELLGIIGGGGGGGGGGGELTLINEQPVTGATTVELVNGVGGVVLDNTYDYYEIHIINGQPSVNGTALYLRFSGDGGTSYYSGISDYAWGYAYQDSIGTASVPVRQAGADDNIVISPNNLSVGWANGQSGGFDAAGFFGTIKLWTPGVVRENHLLQLEFVGVAPDGRSVSIQGHGRLGGGIDNTTVDGLQFRMSSGTFDATIKLYGK